MEPRRTLSVTGEHVSASLISAAQSGKEQLEDRGIDELSRKMYSWSNLWFGPSGSSASTEEHTLVRERLLSWMERCIGLQAHTVLTKRAEDVSLATSIPLLTAFLGRRAMIEISRRVLNDL